MVGQRTGGTLLHTRIHRPKTCSDAVVRTRLFDRLNANLDNPLTLISAPAGFGKTTLVTSWLDHMLAGAGADNDAAPPFHTAWLSVNPVDNDPHAFFSALVAAVESAFPDACAESRALLQSGQPVVLAWLTSVLAQNTHASLTRAQAGLAVLLERSQRINDRRVQHEALVWLAQVKHAQNRQAEALDALAEAVAFGQPRGVVRWFVEGGEPVREMLTQLVRSKRHAEEATALLAEIAQSQRQPAPNATVASPDLDAEPLTNREFEVLELLAARMSNKEIATRLSLSPITVRNHTTHIYEKLHVATRTQAVLQAKALGLIH